MKKKLFSEKLKKHFQEVLEIKKDPHSIAAGFALGTFLAVLPTFGLALFIGLGLILIFRKISKISLLISFAVWNPAVLFALYPVSYSIGTVLLKDYSASFSIELFNTIFVHSGRFLAGSFVLAITLAIVSYLIVLILVYRYEKKKPAGFKEEVEELKETFKV